MRLATTTPLLGTSTGAAAPGDDPWMVRVTLGRSVSPFVGWVERHTAVDLEPDDPTPGVYPLTFEYARIERPHPTAPWRGDLRKIVARNDAEARAISAAMYDAARGFLELGLPPSTDPVDLLAPEHLTIEIGDHTWSFLTRSAPAQAWAVLRAAGSSSR
jgi:hypothetical protein